MSYTKLLLLFGDQNFDLPCSFKELISYRQKSQSLNLFLSGIGEALRKGVLELPVTEQSWFPNFNSTETLAQCINENVGPYTALHTLLTCVIQLGNLILYAIILSCKDLLTQFRLVESDSNLLDSKSDVPIVAICTGGLSGVAACLAKSLLDLNEIAICISQIALRVGVAMQRRAESLEMSSQSWAFSASNIDENELNQAIESYNRVRKHF
jgi:Starter unit:ACP transacylase in aflatoxin biosynthesis